MVRKRYIYKNTSRPNPVVPSRLVPSECVLSGAHTKTLKFKITIQNKKLPPAANYTSSAPLLPHPCAKNDHKPKRDPGDRTG